MIERVACRFGSCLLVLATSTLLLSVGIAAADDDPSQAERERAEQAFQLSLAEAKKYSFSYQDPNSGSPQLQTKPILRWSNPVVGTIYGNVFLWTKDGRPEVVASIYRFFEPYVEFSAEFHALSRHSMRGNREGESVWATSSGGVPYRRLNGAPAAAKTRLGRLRQMRSLAQQFKAALVDVEGVKRNLRLLTQPAFRYTERADQQQLDGGMFAFVLGTDPEVFLLFETRDGQWHYGFTRMCISALQVTRGDSIDWTAPALEEEQFRDRKAVYSIFTLERE